MDLIARVLIFGLGFTLVARTVFSAVQTFVLPRGINDRLTRLVFLTVRRIFEVPLKKTDSYAQRDRIMAYFAPLGLLTLPPVWLILIAAGYTLMYWAIGQVPSLEQAIKVSGSSLLTLGYAAPTDLPDTILMFSEATLGLIMVALLIAYLPTMYGAFQRREAAVSMLEVRAGSPPSAVEAILRYNRIHGLQRLSDLWPLWETWFTDIEESHTSLVALVFFRSPQPDHSWVTAAGAVLDTAALTRSTLDIPMDPHADLCLRAGYIALRRIADYFNVKYNPAPQPTDPISVGRDEFDAAYDQLHAAHVPVRADREAAWRDFVGWRVNYDAVLLSLARITMAPYAPWSSDRSLLPARPAARVQLGRSGK